MSLYSVWEAREHLCETRYRLAQVTQLLRSHGVVGRFVEAEIL